MRFAGTIVLIAGCFVFSRVALSQEAADPAPSAASTDAAVSPAASAGATGAVLPREVHAGVVKSVERSELPVEWVNLDNRLLGGRLEPELDVPPEALEQRPPADGMCYAVVTVRLKDGRSISRYDYRLRAGDTLSPCLALSIAGRPFDVRQWRYALPGEVRLLFECPATASKAALEFAIDSRIPQPTIAGLVLIEEPEPPAPEAAPEQTGETAEKAESAEAGKPAEPQPGDADAQARKPEAEPEKTPAPDKDTKPADKPAKEAPPAEEPKKDKPKDDGALFF